MLKREEKQLQFIWCHHVCVTAERNLNHMKQHVIFTLDESKSLRAQLSVNVTVDKNHVAHTLSLKDKIKTQLAMENNVPVLCVQHGYKYSNVMRVVNVNQLKLLNDIQF